MRQRVRRTRQFQSTSLLRGTTAAQQTAETVQQFQSTSLLRGTTAPALPERRDGKYFNPRPSCEGRRGSPSPRPGCQSHFNPRPSCEGRPGQIDTLADGANFNPRPSCEGRHQHRFAVFARHKFQSTSLLRGTTAKTTEAMRSAVEFQSTSLLRGTTAPFTRRALRRVISIHVPLARDDGKQRDG